MLGKGLGLPITAEGIENEPVLEKLREFEGLRGQGYLYGKPRSSSETRAWLAELGLLTETAEALQGDEPTSDDEVVVEAVPAPRAAQA